VDAKWTRALNVPLEVMGTRVMAETDLYAPLPYRVRDALRRGDLTFDQFAILAYLTGAADHRSHEITVTVGSLADGLQWPHSDDKLRRDLKAVKDGGWIDYEVRERQRRPYVIRLTGALRRPSTVATAARDTPPMRQSTDALRQSATSPFVIPEAVSTPS
jgi:hypothetical protein